MLTTRDLRIINFLEDYKVARTSTIAEMFFPSLNACYNRLQVIHNQKALRRTRDEITSEFVYYKRSLPKQIRHSLMVTDFYRELHKKCEVLSFKVEPVMGDIRPDAIFSYRYHTKIYVGLLEVEISHKGFNSNKYEKFYSSNNYKSFLPVMPTVFVVGDNVKLPQDGKVKYIVINTDFENFKL